VVRLVAFRAITGSDRGGHSGVVLFALSSALYRHGRAVIAVAVLVALAGAATMISSTAYRDAVGLSLFAGMVLAFTGSLIVLNVVSRRAPRTLEVTEDGFTTPRHGGGLLMMASMLPIIGIGIAAAGIEATSGRHLILGSAGVVAGLILIAGLAALLRTVHAVDFTRSGLTLTRPASTGGWNWPRGRSPAPFSSTWPAKCTRLPGSGSALPATRQDRPGPSNHVYLLGVRAR
jgi:hypothetical protein